MREHHYKTTILWTGNRGTGTESYRSYERAYTISIENKADILASSDPAFLGDKLRCNPEELLVASLSGCHMLWYLHLCSERGIKVIDYKDHASGIMEEGKTIGGRFTEVILHPQVIISDPVRIPEANELHQEANKMCFIANSCNFPVRHIPVCEAKASDLKC